MTWTSIGIDIGGTKVLGVRVAGGVVEEQVLTDTPDDPEGLGKCAAEVARSLWSENVHGVGVGVAGLVTWPEGEFVWGPHVAGTAIPLRAELTEVLDVPVVIDNDANMAAWAEFHLGAGAGSKALLLITLGTGIGGALVYDGRLLRGSSFAGEWGHMAFAIPGEPCACGSSGCWETMASGPALLRLAQAEPRLDGLHATRAENVLAAANRGDAVARSLVEEVGHNLGRGMRDLVAILDPDCIVVGGGLGSAGGELLLRPAREELASGLHGGAHRRPPRLVTAALGAAANAIGAGLMAHHVHSGEMVL